MMTKIYKISLLLLLALSPVVLNAQVLITLLLGDALNTDKIEFGLSGGMSRSYINTIDGSSGTNNFDLGFYFHILMKNTSYLSTGVHVKNTLGATGMPTYSVGDAEFDDIYKDGTLTKNVPGFYVPIMFHQRFNNRWYIEAGPQLGLIHQATDIFEVSAFDGDLSYKRKVMDEYKHIDAGLAGGVGYKFHKVTKSMSAGVTYYYGLVNVSKTPDLKIKNSAFYFFLRIPIGVKSKEE